MRIFENILRFLTATFWGTTASPKNLPEEHVDFEFVDITLDEPISAVKLLQDPYAGIIYYYGWVKPQPLDNGVMGLAFQYTLYDTAGRPNKDLVTSKEFTNYLGDVLTTIIMNEQHNLESVTTKDIDDPS